MAADSSLRHLPLTPVGLVERAVVCTSLWVFVWSLGFAGMASYFFGIGVIASVCALSALYALCIGVYYAIKEYCAGMPAFPWFRELAFATGSFLLFPVAVVRKVLRLVIIPVHCTGNVRLDDLVREENKLLYIIGRICFWPAKLLDEMFVAMLRHIEPRDDFSSGAYHINSHLFTPDEDAKSGGVLHVYLKMNAYVGLDYYNDLKNLPGNYHCLVIDYPHCGANIGMSSLGVYEADRMADLIWAKAQQLGKEHVVLEGVSLGGYWAPRIAEALAKKSKERLSISVFSTITLNRISDFAKGFLNTILGSWVGGLCFVVGYPIIWFLTKLSGYQDGQSVLGYHKKFLNHPCIKMLSFGSISDMVVGLASPMRIWHLYKDTSSFWHSVVRISAVVGGVLLGLGAMLLLVYALIMLLPAYPVLVALAPMVQNHFMGSGLFALYAGLALWGSASEILADQDAVSSIKASGKGPDILFENKSWDHFPGRSYKTIDGQKVVDYCGELSNIIHGPVV